MLKKWMKYPWYAGWPLLPLGVLAAFVAWQGHRPFLNVAFSLEDRYRYLALAEQPFGASTAFAREPPYVWRLLTPTLVHILPLPITTGFTLVTLVGLAGATLALVWLLRGLELPPSAAVAGGIAFVCLMPATGFNLYDGLLVDPLGFALLTLALAAAVHQRGIVLLVALVLCAFDKEVAVLGGIFAVAWFWRRNLLYLRWSIACLIITLLVLFSIHSLIQGSRPYGLLGTALFVNQQALQQGLMGQRMLLATVGTWGILLPFACAAPRFWRTPANLLFLTAVTAQVLVSSDVERVVVYAFPVIIAACCCTIESLAASWRVSRWLFWLPVFALELSWSYTYAPDYFFTIKQGHTAEVVVLSLLTLAVLGWRLWQWWMRRKIRPPAGAQVQAQ